MPSSGDGAMTDGTWIKIDDGLPEHPKVAAAGHLAAWLYICGLAYCSRRLTNGAIPKAIVSRLSDVPRPQKAADRLVEVGLWHDRGNHYEVHDYMEHQRSAEQVTEFREAARERKRKWREAQRLKREAEEAEGNADVPPESRWDIDGTVTDVPRDGTPMSRNGHSHVPPAVTETVTEAVSEVLENHHPQVTHDVVLSLADKFGRDIR